ncbi:hypothetical protein JCM3765_000538 [Sporobolomyces pararoseus]
MSSTSPKPPSSTGQCVVCGKETMSKCSSCLTAGVDWMYFCSVEHQKLIWKTHKQVCGKKTFEWPPLSQEEVDEAWQLRKSPLFPNDSTTYVSRFVDGLKEHRPEIASALSHEELEQTCEDLFKGSLDKLRSTSSDPEHQELLYDNRVLSFVVKLTELALRGESKVRMKALQVATSNPIRFLAWIESRQEPKLPLDAKFSSNLQHRLLILLTIVAHEIERPLTSNSVSDVQQHRLVLHALSTVRATCRDGLSNVHPDQSRKVVESMITELFENWTLAKNA